MTLDELAVGVSRLVSIAADARRFGLEVGELAGGGGYATVFVARSALHGRCALKIPWILPRIIDERPERFLRGHGPNVIEQESLTGPFVLRSVGQIEAAQLLAETCARERDRGGPPLVRLLDTPNLGGLTCGLYEFARGKSFRVMLRQGDEVLVTLPALVRAIARLQHSFGAHGDLKPEHIFVEADAIQLIDPLPEGTMLVGSIGYGLPLGDDELRDVAALAAIVAEAHGSDLGWDGRLVYGLVNQRNGRFGYGFAGETWRAEMRATSERLPAPWGRWVARVCDAVADLIGEPKPVCPLPLPGLAGLLLGEILAEL